MHSNFTSTFKRGPAMKRPIWPTLNQSNVIMTAPKPILLYISSGYFQIPLNDSTVVPWLKWPLTVSIALFKQSYPWQCTKADIRIYINVFDCVKFSRKRFRESPFLRWWDLNIQWQDWKFEYKWAGFNERIQLTIASSDLRIYCKYPESRALCRAS